MPVGHKNRTKQKRRKQNIPANAARFTEQNDFFFGNIHNVLPQPVRTLKNGGEYDILFLYSQLQSHSRYLKKFYSPADPLDAAKLAAKFKK